MSLSAIFNILDRYLHFPEASAHCDVPCGIYDTGPAMIAALSVLRAMKQIEALTDSEEDRAKFIRLVQMKEEHAEKVKHEIRIIWGDYIKGAALEKHPDFHELTHKIMMAGSACKQHLDPAEGHKLVELMNEFAEKFWDTKNVKTYRAICPYEPKVETVYPKLDT